jgi:hypothetical protein
MNQPSIEANILEINGGRLYQVKLCSIPRVGDLIHLHSLRDEAILHPSVMFYEVVAVKHEMHDLTDKFPDGDHTATVYVKESVSEFFNTETPPGPGWSTRN